MENFKDFLINEDKSYLGNKIGDILTGIQDLQGDMENLGTRYISRKSEEIVNQIRWVLHGQWDAKHQVILKELQRSAVAIQKTIEDRGDLKQVIPAVAQSLQNLSGKLKVKVNSLEAPPQDMGGKNIMPQDFQSTETPPEQPQASGAIGGMEQNPLPPMA
jgi:hypothetical protein